MGVNQRMIRFALCIAFFLTGCSHQRHAPSAWKSLFVDLPEQIYICPQVNAFKYSKVGVFRFSEPAYAGGTGQDAAEAVFDDLLKKSVFAYIINDATQEYMGTSNSLEFARSRSYDLIITGDVLYYFDGSEFKPSRVNEKIRVIHVPTGRILWSATAESLASPDPSTDFLFFQSKGTPAVSATALVKKNAEKFCNMLLKHPKQKKRLQVAQTSY